MEPPKLYRHQIEAMTNALGKPEFAFFMEQGTGKSAIIIHEIVTLIKLDEVNIAIILSPNGLQRNWEGEFETHAPGANVICQIYKPGNREKMEKRTREILGSGKVLIFLANIEMLQSEYGYSYLMRLLRASEEVTSLLMSRTRSRLLGRNERNGLLN